MSVCKVCGKEVEIVQSKVLTPLQSRDTRFLITLLCLVVTRLRSYVWAESMLWVRTETRRNSMSRKVLFISLRADFTPSHTWFFYFPIVTPHTPNLTEVLLRILKDVMLLSLLYEAPLLIIAACKVSIGSKTNTFLVSSKTLKSTREHNFFWWC